MEHTYAEDGLYDVTLTVTGPGGEDTHIITSAVGETPVAVHDMAPMSFTLYAPYPNPFNPQTTIGFTLPESLPVKLMVHDISGARITTLVDESINAAVSIR